jgi:hypothetical protein
MPAEQKGLQQAIQLSGMPAESDPQAESDTQTTCPAAHTEGCKKGLHALTRAFLQTPAALLTPSPWRIVPGEPAQLKQQVSSRQYRNNVWPASVCS